MLRNREEGYSFLKLGVAAEAVSRFNELIAADGFEHLPVTFLHALKAAALISCDAAFVAFDSNVLW